METLLTKLRDFQKTPIMTRQEQAEQFGVYEPRVRRASLPKYTVNPKQATRNNYQDDEDESTEIIDVLPHTEDLVVIQQQPNNQTPRKHSPWKALLIGAGIPVALYTIIFLIVAGWITISNTWQYGPVHTAYTTTIINNTPSTIITSNTNNTIYVTIINQKDGSSKTYTGPALDANTWGNDINEIVATAEVKTQKGQTTPTININLIGQVNYFHLLFARPQMHFTLVPDKQAGYKVV